ncbi:hypothetical protein [Rhodopila globiformis]|uniref:Uncharacterized protein n=1 Tax=Rhodopila globiformis TaxID=1071 RepID=A0A2S6NID0_RHOGL|nr:hypothetical protein [Rhodopila globiformis]PPQ34402.1 hypothetical protein CCS01_11055 [Rhodopila globiformis]
MSEYQYYEFQAIDRPLSRADQAALRDLSTRARITATSFVNEYNWGDFRGDPLKLMRQWFDLHLYFANWGSRHLMIRLPADLVDRRLLDHIGDAIDGISAEPAGDRIILNIERDIDGGGFPGDDEDDGSGWLAALAPLRAELLAGDNRLFYLLWLMAVEEEGIEPDEPEPLPGIGPMTGALEAFVDFFGIDPDLAEAAAERRALDPVPANAAEAVIAALDSSERNRLLLRVFDGDPLVAAELRAKVRADLPRTPDATPRTAADLLARAEEIRVERAEKEAKRKAEQRRREQERAERERRARLDALIRRGESVWQEIETEIERRNANGYDLAAEMLADMEVIANERGKTVEFTRRLADIRTRHERKKQFLMRIEGLG